MSVISSASSSSCWRGLDYYKKIKNIKKISAAEYTSIACGVEEYSVYLNLEKPRNSICNCLLANGRRIIFKHIVATYFNFVPLSAKKFEEKQNKLQEEYQLYQKNQYKNVIRFINVCQKKISSRVNIYF